MLHSPIVLKYKAAYPSALFLPAPGVVVRPAAKAPTAVLYLEFDLFNA